MAASSYGLIDMSLVTLASGVREVGSHVLYVKQGYSTRHSHASGNPESLPAQSCCVRKRQYLDTRLYGYDGLLNRVLTLVVNHPLTPLLH